VNLKARFFVQFSRQDKRFWYCLNCGAESKKDDKAALVHKPDCWVWGELKDEQDHTSAKTTATV
jgi:hypothetical protein